MRGDRIDARIERQRHVAIARQPVARQIDDMQREAITQARDQRREHTAVHRPSVQQHERRTVADDLDMQTHACGSSGQHDRRRPRARHEPREQADARDDEACAPQRNAARPGFAEEQRAEHHREDQFRRLHRFGGAERGGLVAHHAGGLEEQDRRDDARAERNARREPHLRHRRRACVLERERGHENPRRLAGERHAEHALRGVEVFAGAFQMQQQQAIADRIQRRRTRARTPARSTPRDRAALPHSRTAAARRRRGSRRRRRAPPSAPCAARRDTTAARTTCPQPP